MRRPPLTTAVVEALGAVRAAASIELDTGDQPPDVQRHLQRGIRYIDELIEWCHGRTPGAH